MNPHHKIAVLFDIDGTILHTHHAGRKSFSDALRDVFSWEDDLEHVRFAGNTDLQIIADIMHERGASYSQDQLQAFYRQMEIRLEEHLKSSSPTLYPGVREILNTLSENPAVIIGLVTGNIETCARVKIGQFELNGFFQLGGYGNEHCDRVEIAKLAMERAQNMLIDHQVIQKAFIIGDTPSDIRAARKNQMTSIAVATGSYDAEALQKAGADYVFEDLSDQERLLEALGLK